MNDILSYILIFNSLFIQKKEKSENEKKIQFLNGYISITNDPNKKRIAPMEKSD